MIINFAGIFFNVLMNNIINITFQYTGQMTPCFWFSVILKKYSVENKIFKLAKSWFP